MKEKILIVEDDAQNMELMQMVLGAKGYALLQATDGQEALDVATRERPALIIMDIKLPKMNGLEVTRKLRETPALNHILIIGVTAQAMKGDRERIIGAGCDAYLSKPINTRELPRMIEKMLSKRKKTSLTADSSGKGGHD